MPRNVGGPVRRRPRRFETAANGLGDHVGPAREPSVFGNGLDHLFLIGDLLEAIASRAPGLVGAIGIDNEWRLLLKGVEHLADRIRHADDGSLHDDRGFARGFDVARSHGGAGSLVRSEDVFELWPVDERLVELRILARGIAEDVFHPAADELFGKGGTTGALKRLDANDRSRGRRGRRWRGGGRSWPGLRTGALRVDGTHRRNRGEHRLGGGRGQTGFGQAADEPAPRNSLRQISGNQLSHCSLPWNSRTRRDQRAAIISMGRSPAWNSARNRCRGNRPSN